MLKMTLVGALSAALIGTAAQAVTFLGSTPGPDTGPSAGQSVVLDFNSAVKTGNTATGLPGGYVLTGHNFGFYTGTTPGIAAAPLGDTTRYAAVLGGGSATITFPDTVGTVSLYVGSIDNYNSLTFSFTNTAGNVTTFTGADFAAPANGGQTSSLTNRRLFFAASPGDAISQLTFTSSSNSFEFDDIATGAVPEAATWATMITGMGLVGFAARRRRSPTVTA